MSRVAVIGGGCAGLAAAAELASQGISVTLYEASRQLGGRARGLNWKGKRLDNGQHILLGAYSETLRLLRLAGVDLSTALHRLPLQLIQHRQFRLRASTHLPAPLHILAGLLRADGLSKRERLAALRFMASLKLSGFRLAQDEPLSAFLAGHRQPQKLLQWLWEPICLAALNTPLDRASAQVFLNVLRDSFSRSKSDSDLLLPRCDLSLLLAEPLAEYIRQHGGEVRLGSPATAILQEKDGFVVDNDGDRRQFSHVIAAVSPFRFGEVAAGLHQLQDAAGICAGFDYQPIYTVYLQYPAATRLPFPMIGLTGGYAQWVLDRGALDEQHGLLAVVISAEGRHQSLTQEALAAEVTVELAQAFPDLPPPEWHKVIAEKRATFTCRPNLSRPAQRTLLTNFYLAGDYTAGDYPATIEGAMRSGVKCAHLVLENIGNP
ncbi:MAG TPA: hydroxysqualene dehydroxylase HpnE [Methylophilaceae bacterium]|nr:hydroxysqualene dehydroxylase HpnE [Methylophilaceae bacterium]